MRGWSRRQPQETRTGRWALHCLHAGACGRGGRPGGGQPSRALPAGGGEPQGQGVVVGDGERRRRYVVCHNPSEAERKRRHRAVVLGELATELESLREDNEPGHSKRVWRIAGQCALRPVRSSDPHRPAAERPGPRSRPPNVLDGKFVVHGNDDSLSAEDLALGYKQLQRVEEAWRRLKSGLKLRPVYHFAPQRIRAHVAALGAGAVARAGRRARLRGHLAEHP